MGRISHDRSMTEAQWTPADALGWAQEQPRWPTRRFRVEAQGIKSRLLTEEQAESTRRHRGGKIIEMIPKNRGAAGLPSRRKSKYADLPECPKCKAPAGKPCTTDGKKKAQRTHRPRLATPLSAPVDESAQA